MSVFGWAEFYVDHGLSVIPLKPRTKKPHPDLLRAGSLDSRGVPTQRPFFSRQPTREELKKWFDGRSPEEVGIGNGAGVGRVGIFDIDRDEYYGLIFDLPIQELMQQTWVVKPSKGFHIYVSIPPAAKVQNIEIKRVIEFKARNRYCVAPPSIHPSGIQYRWLSDLSSVMLMEFDRTALEGLLNRLRRLGG